MPPTHESIKGSGKTGAFQVRTCSSRMLWNIRNNAVGLVGTPDLLTKEGRGASVNERCNDE